MRALRRRGWRGCSALAVGAGVALLLLTGCRVVTTSEDQAAAKQGLPKTDAVALVNSGWNGRILKAYRNREVPAGTLLTLLRSAPAEATARFGQRDSEGAAWSFVMGGEGRIRAIDRASRAGSVIIELDGGCSLSAQTGPVVTGTALRDALPFIHFNDFPDQIAFADVNAALNSRSRAVTAANMANLRIGDRVRFEGAFLWRPSDTGVVVTPFVLRAAGRPE